MLSIIPGASANSVSKNVIYITFKDENPSEHKLERKQCDIWFRKKIIYIDIGHKSAAQQTDEEKN